MSSSIFTRAALADLNEIWDYTAEHWNPDQANRYVLAMRDASAALAEGKARGRPIDDIRAGYLKYAVGAHFLFYRLTDGGVIEIVRILHQRMDASTRLQG